MERTEGRPAGPLAVTAPTGFTAPELIAPPGFRARTVDAPGGALTLFESDDVDRDLDAAIARGGPTPYGRVLWPSAAACARVLVELATRISAKSVLELGCGTGLVSLVAMRAGLQVMATDVDEGALIAARAAAATLPAATLPAATLPAATFPAAGALTTTTFDVRSSDPLPPADIIVAADLLYEEVLAAALARRCIEALAEGAHVIVGDPGRLFRTRFDGLVREGAALGKAEPRWIAHDDVGDVVVTILSPRTIHRATGGR